MKEDSRFIGIGDVKALNPNPLCHHIYLSHGKNLQCSKCGKFVFLVPSDWPCPTGWRVKEIDPSTYTIEAKL